MREYRHSHLQYISLVYDFKNHVENYWCRFVRRLNHRVSRKSATLLRRVFAVIILRINVDILEAISSRRSIKTYKEGPISEQSIRDLLEIAVLAPNHRMTQPWRFYVMGPKSRAKFGIALGRRKAKKLEDKEAALAVITKVEEGHRSLPAMLAVGIKLDDNPEIREEDYAATYMAIQNLSLAACSMGLGTHVKTGAIMEDPYARSAIEVKPEERIIATISIGEPSRVPGPKSRKTATDLTTWTP